MFENEYVIDKKRYIKWTVPKFYALPIFYIYMVFFIASIFLLKRSVDNNFPHSQKLLFLFIALAMFYLAFFHKWVVAISQYKIISKKIDNQNLWKFKIVIDNKNIKLFTNDECVNELSLHQIKQLLIADSYLALKQNVESDKILLYNDSYIKGNAEMLIDYIKSNAPEIVIKKERFRYNY